MAMLKTVCYRASDGGGWGLPDLERYLEELKGGKERERPEGRDPKRVETVREQTASAEQAQIAFEAESAFGTIDSIEEYLRSGHGRAGRVLVYAHSESIACDEPSGWADEMIATKRLWNKTDGRQMYQFIISPDPRDRVPPEECAELAAAWAREMYPDAEWVVEVHDDNTHGIVHAHVVMNSVLPETGRKVHRDMARVYEEARVLQRLCAERGMTRMPDLGQRMEEVREDERRRNMQAATVTKAEREMRARGIPCWRADMREAIDRAARRACDWHRFEAILADEGITVERKRRGAITYRMGDWRGQGARSLRDCSLGQAYTVQGILGRLNLDFDAMDGIARDAWGCHGSRRPHRIPAPLVPERLRRKPSSPTEPRTASPAPRTLAEAVSIRTRYNPSVKKVEDLMASLSMLSGEGVSHYAEIAPKRAEIEAELAGIQEDVIAYGRAAERAQHALEAALEARAIHEEIGRLQDWPAWGPEERARFRELSVKAAEAEAVAQEALSSARGWAEANRLPNDDALVATLLLKRIRELLEQKRGQVASVQDRLAAIGRAERTVGKALMKDGPEHRSDGRAGSKQQPKVAYRDIASAAGTAADEGAEQGRGTAQGYNSWVRGRRAGEAEREGGGKARGQERDQSRAGAQQGWARADEQRSRAAHARR